MKTKCCNECKKTKLINYNFSESIQSKDGYKDSCKECLAQLRLAKCMIYKIVNSENNATYFGQSSVGKIRIIRNFKRLSENRHHNHVLQKDYNNNVNLSYEILEYCDKSQLKEREKHYILTHNGLLYNRQIPTNSDKKSSSYIQGSIPQEQRV